MEDLYGDKKVNTRTKVQSFVEPLNPYDELQFTLENGADIQDGIVYLRPHIVTGKQIGRAHV